MQIATSLFRLYRKERCGVNITYGMFVVTVNLEAYRRRDVVPLKSDKQPVIYLKHMGYGSESIH